jgi:hypothetical protein
VRRPLSRLGGLLGLGLLLLLAQDGLGYLLGGRDLVRDALGAGAAGPVLAAAAFTVIRLLLLFVLPGCVLLQLGRVGVALFSARPLDLGVALGQKESMVTRAQIDDFLGCRRLALVGVSASGGKFGNTIRKELFAKGYELRLVHRSAAAIDGRPCAPSLAALAGQVDGAILVTPPAETEKLVREAHAAGIHRLWLQQGAESQAAIALATQLGLSVVHHECILMFARNAGWPHRLHRFFRKLFGQLPA